MGKFKFLLLSIIMAFFFLCLNERVSAQVIIDEVPIASDIHYGQPLFESSLTGGKSNVDGTFRWKNETVVRDVGEYFETVVFTSNEGNIEFDIKVKVNPKRVYIKFEDLLYKQYDESDVIQLPNYVVHGIIDKDVYVKGCLEGKLENIFIGENNKVLLSGIKLVGDIKNNYYLDLDGFTASVYPSSIEKKNGSFSEKIVFLDDVFVPLDSTIQVKERTVSLGKEGYLINKEYDIYVESKGVRVEVNGESIVKIQFDGNVLAKKRLSLFNYYDGEYHELDYSYEEGYLVYRCNGLGVLVVAVKKIDYTWLVVLISVFLFLLLVIVLIVLFKKRKKIEKYKSKKRRRKYGNY